MFSVKKTHKFLKNKAPPPSQKKDKSDKKTKDKKIKNSLSIRTTQTGLADVY
jgi:hypothetical protein